ncbi:MAG: O-antigen ligase family protein [Elusimicrobia bacterium]|nr:O-antigen ligase family protein [Elusimicrobiota bacterium]
MTWAARWSRLAVTLSVCAFCLVVPWTVAGANIVAGVVIASVVAYAVCGGRLDLRAPASPVGGLLAAYLIVSLLCASVGMDPMRSLGWLSRDLYKLWLFVLFSVALALEPAPEALLCLAVAFAGTAAGGLGQSACRLAAGQSWWSARAHALVHPVVFAEQMSVALLGACCFLLKPRPAWGRRAKAATIALAAVLAAALLASLARMPVAAVVAGLAAGGLLLPDRRRRVLFALPIALLAALAIGDVMGRLRTQPMEAELAAWNQAGGTLPQGSSLARLVFWDVAWRIGRDHPWTGVGGGNFRAAFHAYHSGPLAGKSDWGDPHNLYLQTFAERGLAGLAALLALGVFAGLRAFRRAKEDPTALNLWAFGTVTAFAVMNMTESAFNTETLWMLVLFVWTWAEAVHARASEPDRAAALGG